MHQKSIKMRSRTLREASWKQVGSPNVKKWHHLMLGAPFFAGKSDFGSHFGSPVDFEGGPKITFLVIMLEKNEKKEVRERFWKKHEMLMDF